MDFRGAARRGAARLLRRFHRASACTDVTTALAERHSRSCDDVASRAMETSATDGDGDDDDDLEAEITRMMLERRDDDGENAKKRPRVSRAADEGAVEEAEAGPFSTLHDDVVSLILRFLAPNELTSLAQTCKFFAARCDQDFLWRQCYLERFGNTKQAQGNGMKKLYLAADAMEINRERRKAPAGFEKICAEACAAKRSRQNAVLAPLCEQLATDRAASEWKSHRQFATDADSHVCSRRAGCSYAELPSNVFVCERTGKVHVCDDTCSERYLDTEIGTEICEVSGRVLDTVAADDEDEDPQATAEQDQHYFEKGYFGRAFEVGYGCDNEAELATALWGGRRY